MKALFHTLCLCLLVLTPLLGAERWQRFDAAVRLADDDPAAARTALEALITDHPDCAASRYNLGRLLLDEDPATAAEHLRRATRSAIPELAARAWHNLALALHRSGRPEQALEAAAEALALAENEAAYQHTHNELRRAWLLHQDALRRQAEAEARRLRLLDSRLPDAYQDEAYAHSLQAAGGSGTGYRFRIETDTPLPAGLTLDADGRLHGIPTQGGDTPLQATIILSDDTDTTARGEISLRIWPPPGIEPEYLSEVITGLPYQEHLRAHGLPTVTWSVDGLPEGLRYEAKDAGLRLQGSSTKLGTYPIRVRAVQERSDAPDRVAERSYDLVVSDSFAPDTATMPPATAWAGYRHQLTVRGPALDYRFGGGGEHLTVGPRGEVAGTPDAAGEIELPLVITASDGRRRDFVLRLPVNPPPVIEEHEPISLIHGRPVDRPLQLSDGTPPYTWAISEGLLPDGLRLDPDGHLRGAAAEQGETTVTVAVSDRWQATARTEVTLRIEAADEQDDSPESQEGEEESEGEEEEGQENEDGTEQDDQNGADDTEPPKEEADTGDEQQDESQGEAEQENEEDEEDQTRSLERAATRHWLDQLPPEDLQSLHRMLQEQAGQPPSPDQPW